MKGAKRAVTIAEALLLASAAFLTAVALLWTPPVAPKAAGQAAERAAEQTGHVREQQELDEPRRAPPALLAEFFADPPPPAPQPAPPQEEEPEPEPEPDPPGQTELLAYVGERREGEAAAYYFKHQPTGTLITLSPGTTSRGWTLIEMRNESALVAFKGTRYTVRR